jgi:hypothetical protein
VVEVTGRFAYEAVIQPRNVKQGLALSKKFALVTV